jgi:hypothetical protein
LKTEGLYEPSNIGQTVIPLQRIVSIWLRRSFDPLLPGAMSMWLAFEIPFAADFKRNKSTRISPDRAG